MKITGALLILVLFGSSSFTHARELSDMNLEITSEKQGAEAKQDAFDQATEEGTRRTVEDLLGPEKTAAVWTQIKTKLLKNSTRYVLFIKGGAPVGPVDANKLSVQLRISPDSLEAMLREMGLFGASAVRVLALVQIREGRGSRYAWWVNPGEPVAPSAAFDDYKKIYAHLNAHFKTRGLTVIDPLNPSFLAQSVPSNVRTENLKREEQTQLGQILRADVILSGRIEISRARPDSAEQKIDYDLQVWQVKNGRAVAETTVREDVPTDQPKVMNSHLERADKRVFNDLGGKLADAASNGNLNLSTIPVSVLGDLGYREQRELRRQLTELREVRSIKERLFEPGRVTFEVESPAGADQLAKAVQRAHPKLGVEVTPDHGLVLTPRASTGR